MFARSRAITVAAFTPSALPDFFAIPAAIPGRQPSVSLLFTVVLTYSTRSDCEPRAFRPAWLILYHHVLLDAVYDPGA